MILLHRFLACLEQSPRHKQPADFHRSCHELESFEGRLGQSATGTSLTTQRLPCGKLAHSISCNDTTTEAQACSEPTVAAADTTMDAKRELPACIVAQQWTVDCYGAKPETDALQLTSDDAAASFADVTSAHLRAGTTVQAASTTPAVATDTAADRPPDLIHFQIDHVFEVATVGTIVSGTVVSGEIIKGKRCWWGPCDDDGAFIHVRVSGIHRSQVPVMRVCAGQYATLAIDAAPVVSAGKRSSTSTEGTHLPHGDVMLMRASDGDASSGLCSSVQRSVAHKPTGSGTIAAQSAVAVPDMAGTGISGGRAANPTTSADAKTTKHCEAIFKGAHTVVNP